MNIAQIGHNGGPAMFQARYYQTEAVDAIFRELASSSTSHTLVLMPTGTGKSVVIGGFIYEVLQRWWNRRVIIGTHSKELVKQNAAKLAQMWPGAPIGIHSDGLGQRDTEQPIIYGGIQSMIANPTAFGHRDLLIIDEAQMVGDNEGEWLLFIRALKEKNPWLRVIGLTATGYRMGMGWLTNGSVFDNVCYDITSLEAFNRLVAEGYLAPLISPRTEVGISRAGVKTSSNGDYVQSQAEKAAMQVTWDAVQDASKYRYNRHTWLVFAGGIEHAEKTAEMFRAIGMTATAVHSGNKDYPMKAAEADQRLADFMAGKYQVCVNYGKLTTGFDLPRIDLIMMLRLTKSTVLWVQMLGRGTRPFEGDYLFPRKSNCLVLDYARNIETLGPINDPVIPRPKGQGSGEAPVKICEECGTYNHISNRWCVGCGCEFEFAVKVKKAADETNEPLRDLMPDLRWFDVERVYMRRHKSKHSNLDTMAVSYSVRGQTLPFNEWVSIESAGKARERAEEWWQQRHAGDCPLTINEALLMQSQLRVPKRIQVQMNLQHPEIKRFEYE